MAKELFPPSPGKRDKYVHVPTAQNIPQLIKSYLATNMPEKTVGGCKCNAMIVKGKMLKKSED